MDETRIREVIREEITLAVQTLADQMYDSDPESTGVGFEQAASYFTSFAYRGACEQADAERAAEAENPFAENATGSADAACSKLIRDEVLTVLKEMRNSFFGSGMRGDYLIAERLDRIIAARKAANE